MQKILVALLVGAGALMGAFTPALAQEPAPAGDAKRGGLLSDTCMGCHGIPSYRNAYPSFRVPKLGGQHPEYIVLALQGYRAETRGHGTMHAQAATMTDQDMRDIAAFFATQGEVKPVAPGSAPAFEKAATCVACHGEGGISIAPNWPTIAGQYRDYLEHTLNQYKNGQRKDPVMGSQAINLKPEDIEALAIYFSSQPGLFTIQYTGK